jgi:hypothetical protein
MFNRLSSTLRFPSLLFNSLFIRFLILYFNSQVDDFMITELKYIVRIDILVLSASEYDVFFKK